MRTKIVRNRTKSFVCVLLGIFLRKVQFVRYSCIICADFVRLQQLVYQLFAL